MEIVAKERQTLEDISLQYCGGVEAMIDVAALNGLSVTEELADGQVIVVPDVAYSSKIVNRYRVKHIEPATEASEDDLSVCPYGGIGYMGIEIDFEVS